MKTIILNSTNIVAGSNNSLLQYNFPAGAVHFENQEVAIVSVSMYYSWFNIDASLYNNATYTYNWLGTDFTVTMPNGNYSVDDLNTYLQNYMIGQGHYLVDGAGDNVYYIEWVLNPSRYAVQLNEYPIPTSLPAGYTKPASATWFFPATASTPTLTILSNNNFGSIVGFSAGTYPSVSQSTNYSVLSTTAPQVSPVSSMVMECNLVNNSLSVPSKLLFSFTPTNVSFGGTIYISPPQYSFNDIYNGFYNFITISFKDQNLRPVVIQDPQMVIMLSIREKSEGVERLKQSGTR